MPAAPTELEDLDRHIAALQEEADRRVMGLHRGARLRAQGRQAARGAEAATAHRRGAHQGSRDASGAKGRRQVIPFALGFLVGAAAAAAPVVRVAARGL